MASCDDGNVKAARTKHLTYGVGYSWFDVLTSALSARPRVCNDVMKFAEAVSALVRDASKEE